MSKDWYYASYDQPVGPVTEDELRGLIKSARLTLDTLVWSAGSNAAAGGWIRAGDTELASFFVTKTEKEPQIYPHNIPDDHEYNPDAPVRLFSWSSLLAVALIFISVLVYVCLKYHLQASGVNASVFTKAKNVIVNTFVLKPFTLLFVTSLLHALRSSVVPVILYIIVLRLSGGANNWLTAKKAISIIAIIGLGIILALSFKPKSIIDVGALISWFWRFVDTCLMAVVFGFLFFSKKFGVYIAAGAVSIVNICVKLALNSIATIASWVPVISGIAYSGMQLTYLILLCVEISQVLMLAAVSIIFKSIIDYVDYKLRKN